MMMAGSVMLYRCRVIVKSPMPPMVLREWASIALGATRLFWAFSLKGKRVRASGGKPGVC